MKKVLKAITVMAGIVGALYILYPYLLRLTTWLIYRVDIGNSRKASSIGIIGGADGPTAIYVASRIAKLRRK